MVLSSESFLDGDRQTGVLLRDLRDDQLATFVAFLVDDGAPYRAEQVTDLGPGPQEWTAFRFTEALSGAVTLGVCDRHGVSVGGMLLDRAATPSYLGWRILTHLARQGGERAQFSQLDEHGEARLHAAEYVSRGVEAVDLPGLGLEAAHRYDLLLDGAPYTSFWWDGQSVVASDWTGGAMSVLRPNLEDALAQCPVPVAELARTWVAGRHL